MDNRIYILLDIAYGKVEQVTQVLQESPGVVMVDAVEGPPEVIVVVEADEREQLVKLTVQALDSVETAIENVCLLPARDRLDSSASPKLSSRSKGKNRNSGKRGCQINQGE